MGEGGGEEGTRNGYVRPAAGSGGERSGGYLLRFKESKFAARVREIRLQLPDLLVCLTSLRVLPFQRQCVVVLDGLNVCAVLRIQFADVLCLLGVGGGLVEVQPLDLRRA